MPRRPLEISPEALFRYQWVAELEARVSAGEPLARAIEHIRREPRISPRGRPRCPSVRTLYRWLAAYRRAGLAGLEPSARPRIEGSRALSEDFLELLTEAKTRDPELSIPDVIERARLAGVLGAEEPVSRTTVWRAARRMGLATSRRRALEVSDTRRFVYPHRMMMVLADGKHFRAGARRLKRVALSFLDDATRFGLGIFVGPTETTELFLGGLHEIILRYGLMTAIYLERGPGFRSHDTRAVFARLKRPLILGRARYPEGRGKVERYHRTLISKALRDLDGNPEVDPDCKALALRLGHWLTQYYNHRPHEGLDGASPAERFHADTRDLHLPSDRAWLDAQFVVTEERTVTKDHVVSIDGTPYEVPRTCFGRIPIQRHLLTARLTVDVDGEPVEIHPVDPIQNAFDRRGRDREAPKESSNPRTLASEAFDRDFGPIVTEDGDYPDKDDTDDDD